MFAFLKCDNFPFILIVNSDPVPDHTLWILNSRKLPPLHPLISSYGSDNVLFCSTAYLFVRRRVLGGQAARCPDHGHQWSLLRTWPLETDPTPARSSTSRCPMSIPATGESQVALMQVKSFLILWYFFLDEKVETVEKKWDFIGLFY